MLSYWLVVLLPFVNLQRTYNSSLAPVLVGVANKYFTFRSRLIFEFGAAQPDLFTEVLKNHNALIVVERTPLPSLTEIRNAMNGKCDIILLMGPYQGKGKVFGIVEWRELRWNPGGRILVVANGTKRLALSVIQGMWHNSKTKNVVVATMGQDSIQFYAWTPYRANECDRVLTIDLVDEWKNGRFVNNAVLYAHHKIKKLHGCPVKITSVQIVPFVMNNFTDGLEIRIVDILKKYFDFQTKFIELAPNEFFDGIVDSNNSHSRFQGAFRLLFEQKVDMAFSGLSAQVERYEASQPLYPYMIEKIVWIGPAPRTSSPLQNFFRTFSFSLWLMILVSLIFASLIIFAIDTGNRDLSTSFFYTLGVLLNGMPPFRANNWYLRAVTIFVTLLAIHLFIAYQSSLIFLLRTSILEKPYETVAEMANEGMSCLIYTSGAGLIKRVDDPEALPKSCKNFPSFPGMEPAFQAVAHKRTAFMLFPETPIAFFSFRNLRDAEGRSLVRTLPEPFMVLPTSLYMSPGHPLAEVMNKKLQQVVEVGMLRYWMDMIKRISKEDDFDLENEEENSQALSTQHLLGPFLLFLLNVMLSFFVFTAELLSVRFKAFKRVFNI